MERRGILKALVGVLTAAWTGRTVSAQRAQTPAPTQRAQPAVPPGVPQTRHIRIYVEMDVAAAREQAMLDYFHNVFVPEAVKHEGYIRVKMLKRRSVIQGTVPPTQNYRFELEFENEDLRKKWHDSPEHSRVWPPLEAMMTTKTNYPVTLYDEV